MLPLAAQESGPDPAGQRAKLVWEAVLKEPSKLNGSAPMHFWVAQHLFEVARNDEAVGIVSSGVKRMRASIELREKAGSTNIGANGFLYWASLDCYVRWHHRFPQSLLDDYRHVFTHARNYKGTTGNLSLIHTLSLHLAERIWGAESLPADGRYGPRGETAVKWLTRRVEQVAKHGYGEFASRPYMIYNVGTLLTLDSERIDPALRNKARMAFDISIAHAAATWLRGHWAVPSGRSYPDLLTQSPAGSAAMLWTYFGGVAPLFNDRSSAIFSAAADYRPHPMIVKVATDRSQPYVCRSRFDGDKLFQTTFMNKTYAVFSTAVLPGVQFWGQTYPYGVMWDEPDEAKGSHLWLTVPASDGKPLGQATHGIQSKLVRFTQFRGSLLMLANGLNSPGVKHPYVLGMVPGGWRAVIDESESRGRIFLHYGSVLIALSSTRDFTWRRDAGLRSGSPRPLDSEFRIEGDSTAIGLQTALPDEFPAPSPLEQLRAFRQSCVERGSIQVESDPPRASFTDREGNIIERIFEGDARVNGERVAYESWPLLENPWMHHEFGGNLTIRDGGSSRTYDVTNWTITDSP